MTSKSKGGSKKQGTKVATKRGVGVNGSSVPQDICFTIMPFGGWFDDYFEGIYKPAIEAAGLMPRRADDLYRPSAIVHDIWDLTKSSKILLADLTGKNPNVFYELGLAHAIARPAVLVAESIDDVPFDLRALRVILYDRNRPDWGNVLKQAITRSLKEVLESPQSAVLPTFLGAVSPPPLPTSKEDLEYFALKQDLDFVKRQLTAQNDFLSKLKVNNKPVFAPAPALPDPALRLSRLESMVWELLNDKIPPKIALDALVNNGFEKTAVEIAIQNVSSLLASQQAQ